MPVRPLSLGAVQMTVGFWGKGLAETIYAKPSCELHGLSVMERRHLYLLPQSDGYVALNLALCWTLDA